MTNKIPKKKDRPGVDRYGRTELHYAALEGNVQKTNDLIEAQSDVNLQDDDGRTPLHFAAQGRHTEVADVLLKHRANPNLTDSHGNSPLWTAIMNSRGEFTTVRLLPSAGADPFHKNRHGKSPFDISKTIAWTGLKEIFEELVKE